MATGKIVKEYTKGQIDNILKTNEMNELEEIEASSINGFTHILTFYIV